MSTQVSGFGRLRAFLWPIQSHENKKFLPMLIIYFLICFNYNLLHTIKDALVVTAPSSGAAAIPFLKVWAILPMAFLFTFMFTRLANHLQKEKILYVIISGFIAYFFIFGFFLHPYRDHLHPNDFCDKLQAALPVGFKGFIAVFRNWTLTTFYVMAEMWSTIVMTVLFWGFANDVTSVKDAKRVYGLLGLSANCSSIFAGQAATWISQHKYSAHLPFGSDAWGQSIILLVSLIIGSGLVCMGLFRWLHKQGLGYNSAFYTERQKKEEPVKMGLRKNFAYLAKSKYLICIAIIVVSYNIAINLVEVIWKDQVHHLYPHPNDYNAYMGKVVTSIGVVSTLISIFVTGTVMRRTSWTFSAMITPFILLVTGVGFFFFLLFKDTPALNGLSTLIGASSLVLCTFLGSVQNCFSRASKYTVFDATKEMAFIPLSNECKLKGKAAIDGVGSRLGKSGGSVIHQGLLMLFGAVSASAPYVGFIFLLSIGAWMIAVKALGKRFNELVEHHETLEVKETEIVHPQTEELAAKAP